jgi:hypothetical protein
MIAVRRSARGSVAARMALRAMGGRASDLRAGCGRRARHGARRSSVRARFLGSRAGLHLEREAPHSASWPHSVPSLDEPLSLQKLLDYGE